VALATIDDTIGGGRLGVEWERCISSIRVEGLIGSSSFLRCVLGAGRRRTVLGIGVVW
jgi:hypothetical protein